jgi:hypothetical protein
MTGVTPIDRGTADAGSTADAASTADADTMADAGSTAVADPGERRRDRYRPGRLEWLVPLGLGVLAIVLRGVDLATRGPWDRDQGHDLLVLLGLVRDGQVPLLGPPTSIGDFHHGALYYYLLAPAALVSDADPLAVVTLIAATGVAAVVVTWWLARSIGGPWAGLIAGGLLAVSATAVETSTWIWNPNLIPLASAIALAGAWWAWDARRPNGWLVAAIGVAVTVQCHVLGSVLLVPLAVLWALDLRRQREPDDRRALRNAGIVALLILVVSYVPLAVHELTADFSEVAAAIAFLTSGGGSTAADPVTRLLVVGLRIVSWPLSGLIVDAPLVAVAVAAGAIALVAWLAVAGRPRERAAMRFLGGTLAWSWLALTVGAASLATVVRALPVDHYHAFLDPLIVVVVGVGLAGLAVRSRPGAVVAAVATVGLVGFNLATQPAAIASDGGWPAAEAAGARILATTGDATLAFVGLPDFKGPEAYVFPVTRAGATVAPNDRPLPTDGVVVVLCEDLFRESIGADCGGPAEDAAAAASGAVAGRPVALLERFDPAPGRHLSLYRVGPGPD